MAIRNDAFNLTKNEMIMVMHDQEQEIESLKAQVAELQKKLDNYNIKVEEAGNLADAAAKISGVFEAAQVAAELYMSSMKIRSDRSETILGEVEKQADEIISEAEEVAKQRIAAADLEVERKWSMIESRMLALYESHQGLREIMANVQEHSTDDKAE